MMVLHLTSFEAFPVTRPPAGDLFLPIIERCCHCNGSGIYKIWGMYDIVCYLCGGTGEYK
jgi:hypothetical protein